MKKIMLSLLLLSLSVAVMAQCNNTIPFVSVNGSAKISIEADQANIFITIKDNEGKGKAAVEEKEKSLMKLLKEFNIDIEKDLQILGYKSETAKRNESTMQKDYRLTIKGISNLDKLTRTLTDAKPNIISSFDIANITSSKAASVRLEAKTLAVKEAIAKAKVLAEAAGCRLGMVREINDYERDMPAIFNKSMMMFAEGRAADNGGEEFPDLSYKNIEITSNITVKIDILQRVNPKYEEFGE